MKIKWITGMFLGWAMGWGGIGWGLPEGSFDAQGYAQRRAQYKVREDLSYRTVAADPERYRGLVLELIGSIRGRIDTSQQMVFILRTRQGETLCLKSATESFPVSTGTTVKTLARVPAEGSLQELELLAIMPHSSSSSESPQEPSPSPYLPPTIVLGRSGGTPSSPPPPQVMSRTRLSPPPPSSASSPLRRIRRGPVLPSRGRGVRRDQVTATAASKVAQVVSIIAAYNPQVHPVERQAIAQGIVGYSEMFGLRWEFFTALIIAESNFKRTAVSPVGALGLGQLMPGTAASLGVADPFNINQNLYGSARYIRTQLDRFALYPPNEQFALALAAYNAGPGAVAKYGGVPPYRETINFIHRIARLYTSFCPETRGR